MASELVYDADAALTAQLLGGMRSEARIGLVAPLFYEHVDIGGPTLTAPGPITFIEGSTLFTNS